MRQTALTVLALLSSTVYAQPGAFDDSFAGTGILLVPTLGTGADDQAVTAVVLPDGKILVAGRSSDGGEKKSVLVRFNADGSPDLSFGSDGLVQHDLSEGDEFIRSSALDAQGRLVVGGYMLNDELTNSDMFVARFLPDGSLDPAFNGSGLLVRDIHTTPDAEEGHEVLVQPDGKIVLCGFTGPSSDLTEIVVERYLDNGELDPAFGGDGSVLAIISNGSGEQVRGATLGPNGDIYFCGYVIPLMETEQAVLLGRINSVGDSPSDFGNNNGHSIVLVDGSDLIARTMALMPDGGLVVAGAKRTTGATQAQFIFTFDADGSEVADEFYDDPDGGDAWNALLVQNNGSIICGGNVADGPDSRNWSVERVNSDLTSDPVFATIDYDEDGGAETCFSLEFAGDSSIIGIGYVEAAGVTRIALVKYENDISSGLHEGADNGAINAFPNPTVDRTVIGLNAQAQGTYALRLIDAQGRSVRDWSSRSSGRGGFEVDLSSLGSGVYTLQAQNALGRRSIKIVKQ